MDINKLKFTSLENELFSFLSLRAGERFSQREIAKSLNVSPTAIANSVKKLLTLNFIKKEITKTINFISFNRDNHKAIELKRAENLKNILISGLSDFLEEQFAGSTIILFGSYSKGEDTLSSDIDLAIIGRKNKQINLSKYETALRRKINLNFYDSFKVIHTNLKNNILNGIILCGGVML